MPGRITELKERMCPICGKPFYPTGDHIYRIKAVRNTGAKKVCSYSCQRKFEKGEAKYVPVRKDKTDVGI